MRLDKGTEGARGEGLVYRGQVTKRNGHDPEVGHRYRTRSALEMRSMLEVQIWRGLFMALLGSTSGMRGLECFGARMDTIQEVNSLARRAETVIFPNDQKSVCDSRISRAEARS